MAHLTGAYLVVIPVGIVISAQPSAEAAVAAAKAAIAVTIAGSILYSANGPGAIADLQTVATTSPVTMAAAHAGEGGFSQASLQAYMNRLLDCE